jgi:hypothetical protein
MSVDAISLWRENSLISVQYVHTCPQRINANIKKDPRVPYVGHHSLHEFNNNGIMMTDFAVTRSLVVSSMMFSHKSVPKKTWIYLDGGTRNQINHVMIDTRHARNINDVRSYRGADCNSELTTARF